MLGPTITGALLHSAESSLRPLDREVAIGDDQPPLMSPASFATSFDAGQLPPVLAEHARDIDERIGSGDRLKAMFDFFETLLRFSAGLALGELRRQRIEVPDDLAWMLLSELAQPSMDTWYQLARKAAKLLPPHGPLCELAAELASIQSITNQVRTRRNASSHGVVGDAWKAECCEELRDSIQAAVRKLSWLPRVSLQWNGDSSSVCAELAGNAIPMYPFLVVMPARGVLIKGTAPAGPTTTTLGVLKKVHKDWDALEVYTVDAGATAVTAEQVKLKQRPELAELRDWCRFNERDSIGGRLPSFDGALNNLPELRGREFDRDRVIDAVDTHRVVWVSGPAGIGKTLLAAHCADRLRKLGWRVIYWRFGRGDPRNHRRPFLKYLEEQLRRHYGDEHERGRELRLGDDPQAWIPFITRLLVAPVTPISSTVVVLDGLDECDDDALVEIPFQFDAPELRWLCTGRPTNRLEQTFRADRCHRPFDTGLGRLGPKAVEEWLATELPNLAHRAVDIAVASEGIPQYVRLFIDEIAQGWTPSTLLPRGLPAFLREAIDRAGSRSPEVADIFLKVLIAAALSVGPVDRGWIQEILRRMGALAGEPNDDADAALVEQALRDASSLLAGDRTAEGISYRVAHASLADLLTSERAYRGPLASYKRAVLDLVRTPLAANARVQTLARDVGLRQLLRLDLTAEAAALLVDYQWVRLRLFDDGVAASGDRESSIRQLIEDFDAVQSRISDDELATIRRLLAAEWMAIVDDGEQALFQAVANGDAGPSWRRRAQAWAIENGWRKPWLQRVAVAGQSLRRHMLADIAVESAVDSMLFEPDGVHLIVAHKDGDATRWHVPSARCVATLAGVRGRLLAFDGSGEFATHQDRTGEVVSWRPIDGGGYQRGTAHSVGGKLHGAWIGQDGSLLVAAQDVARALLLRVRDGEVIAEHTIEGNARLAFLSATTCLVGSGGGYLSAVSSQGSVPFNVPAFVVDGKREAFVGCPLFHNAVEVRNLTTLELLAEVPAPALLAMRCAGPAGDVVVLDGPDGTLLIDVERRAAKLVRDLHRGPGPVALDQTGARLAVTGLGSVQIWDARALLAIDSASVSDDSWPVLRIAIAAGSERVACLRQNGDLEWFDFSSGRSLGVRHISPSVDQDRSARSRDGRRIAVALSDYCGVLVIDAAGSEYCMADDLFTANEIERLDLGTDGTVLRVSMKDGRDLAFDVASRNAIAEWDERDLGRHFSMEDPRHHESADHPSDRRARVDDWAFPAKLGVGDSFPVFGTASWWATGPVSAVGVAQDGRLAVATRDGAVTFLRYRIGVPFEPRTV